jgi:asparagine synthase (glutamine-hydrolysing)
MAAIERAIASIHHRGPDDSGVWNDGPVTLGHRRLSIIDLGTGQQPMASHDGRFVIVYNGEIYNYVEVREELLRQGARFSTQSDTEVIIEAFRAYDTAALARLSGMFAFALYDRKERTLLLARDRLGEKPLIYTQTETHGVTFASELKALVAAGVVGTEIDPEVLELYLTLNYVPGTRLLLRGVSRVAPGHWLRFRAGRLVDGGRYWSPPDPGAAPLQYASEAEALPELRSRLDHAVKIALRSDVPLTLFLSGGIDSSLIAESAVRQGMIRTAYCLDFDEEGFSEWKHAKFAADALGLELRRAVARVPDFDTFRRIVSHTDDPTADSSAVAVWYLAQRTAQDFKVVITGDGGDELFGGYLTYQASRLYAVLHRYLPSSLLKLIAWPFDRLSAGDGKVAATYKAQRFARAFGLSPGLAHMTWNGAFMPREARALIAPEFRGSDSFLPLERLISEHQMPASPALRDLQRLDALEYLPNDILAKVDRVTMAHGLESRAPFLSPEVAEFGLALPEALKLQWSGRPKRVLRSLASATLGPEIGAANKKGFSIPVHRWLRGAMRDSLEASLGTEAIAGLPFLDAKAVAALCDQHVSGRAQLGFELWGLMALSAWWRQVSAPAATNSSRSTPPSAPLVLKELAT